jgi:hypothetical protein
MEAGIGADTWNEGIAARLGTPIANNQPKQMYPMNRGNCDIG